MGLFDTLTALTGNLLGRVTRYITYLTGTATLDTQQLAIWPGLESDPLTIHNLKDGRGIRGIC